MEATKKFKGHLDRLVIDLMNKISKLSIKLTDSQSVEEMIVTSFKISDYSQRLSFLNKFRSGCEESMYYESDEVFFKEFLVSYTQQVLTFIINDTYGWKNPVVKHTFIVLLPVIKETYKNVVSDTAMSKFDLVVDIALSI